MLSPLSTFLAVLCLAATSLCQEYEVKDTGSPNYNKTIIEHPACSRNVTVFETMTIISSTIVPVTHYVDVVVTNYETETVKSCVTEIETETECTTTTLHFTVSVTDTETDSTTITDTETDSATIVDTETATATVAATVTTYTTKTITTTTYDPCPSTCSISVATVNLFFWPTDRPYTYPSTYVDTAMGYTFTSPSLYMYIPTAMGTNSLGPAGPATSNWMLPLDLDEVSTVDGTLTRQLTLSDLGTDCPQTVNPSAIATMVDTHCDPILAAPPQVRAWASPCNACGRFGLFDPPYAIPTLTGGLVPVTTAVPVKTTIAAPTPTATSTPTGVLLIVTYEDGRAMGTRTVATTGVTGTWSSAVTLSLTSAPVTTSTPAAVTTANSSLTSSMTTTVSTSPVAASAPRVIGGIAELISTILMLAAVM